jgi:hypothetical protein
MSKMPVDIGTRLDLLRSGMRAMQWEKAKGELQAMVALVGNTIQARPVGDDDPAAWEKLEERVDTFIKEIEFLGLHE